MDHEILLPNTGWPIQEGEIPSSKNVAFWPANQPSAPQVIKTRLHCTCSTPYCTCCKGSSGVSMISLPSNANAQLPWQPMVFGEKALPVYHGPLVLLSELSQEGKKVSPWQNWVNISFLPKAINRHGNRKLALPSNNRPKTANNPPHQPTHKTHVHVYDVHYVLGH